MTPERLVEQVKAAVEHVRQNYDPTEQIGVCTILNQALLDGQAEVASLRREAVRTLRMEGWTLRDIAAATGMTHQRVGQIEMGADRKDKK